MMGMGSLEVLVILLIAFIFLGPQKMIEAARALGKLVGQAKNMAADIPHLDLDDIDTQEIAHELKTVDKGQTAGENRVNKAVGSDAADTPIPFKPLRNPILQSEDDEYEVDPVSNEGDTGETRSSGEVREG